MRRMADEYYAMDSGCFHSHRLDDLMTNPYHAVGWESRRYFSWTNKELCLAINARGVLISEAYLSQLRNGARSNPNRELVSTLATLLCVPVEYFYGVDSLPPSRTASRADRTLISGLENSGLQRLLRASMGLSADSIELLIRTTEAFRSAESLISHDERSSLDDFQKGGYRRRRRTA